MGQNAQQIARSQWKNKKMLLGNYLKRLGSTDGIAKGQIAC
jgi:hypothetical protein